MDADQHVLAVADVALDERDVRLLVEDALERGDAEVAVSGRQRRGRDAAHQRLGAHPVLDQIRDRDHQQLVPLRELRQLRHAGHRAVLVHDFADDAGRIEAGDAREIDGRFGLAGAHEHAAGRAPAAATCARAARDPTGLVFGSTAARTVAARSAAEIPVVT